jgi:hypothetical protein
LDTSAGLDADDIPATETTDRSTTGSLESAPGIVPSAERRLTASQNAGIPKHGWICQG